MPSTCRVQSAEHKHGLISRRQELVGGNAEKRNWKGMLIAILVILIVCGFVVLAVFLSAEEQRPRNVVGEKDITERLWEKALAQECQWIGKSFIWKDKWNNIKYTENSTKIENILVQNSTLTKFGAKKFVISSNLKYALFIYKIVPRYSKSFSAEYTVYNVDNGSSQKLFHKKRHTSFQYVNFGPSGDDLVYIYKRNLYYVNDVSQLFTNSHDVFPITDVSHERVFSGITDWLYEEEVMTSHVANWWNKDGSLLAFAQFDDSKVKDSFVTTYFKETNTGAQQLNAYPNVESYPCPKPGEKQPIVRLKVFNKTSLNSSLIDIPPLKNSRLNLLQSVVWSRSDDLLLVIWSDRTQREALVQVCDVTSNNCREDVATVGPNNRNGWIHDLANTPPITVKGSSSFKKVFFWLMPSNQGRYGNFKHIRILNFTEEVTERHFLTEGRFEVTQILHYQPETNSLYFLSNEEGDDLSQHLFHLHVDVESLNIKPETTCLTCNGEISGCKFHDAMFSAESDEVLVNCLGPNVPKSYLAKIKGKIWTQPLVSVEGNLNEDELSHLDRDNSEYMYDYLTIHSRNRNISVQIGRPLDIEAGKFGVIIEIGEIGTKKVNHAYKLSFLEYMSSRYNMYTIRFDGAGSSLSGENVLHSASEDPAGEIIKDATEIIEFLDDSKKYSIGAAILIGKGFGGYVSIFSVVGPKNERLPCAIANSPFVDWEAHTSVPSEKVLGKFEENMRKYSKNSILQSSMKFEDKSVLIFHGLADRKVHHQHTVALSELSKPRDFVEAIFYATQRHKVTNKVDQHDVIEKSRSYVQSCFRASPLSV